MSSDRPFYDALSRQSHRAAPWWLIGDRLYYLGLLPAMLALPSAGILFVAWLLAWGEHYLVVASFAAVTFLCAAVVCVVGALVKRHAYVLAERDGILADVIYSGGAAVGGQDAEPDN